jgi:Xaa-Pro aminopeptidase
MSYDFTRYVSYMAQHGLDAVVASSYEATARILGRYFKDNMWMAAGTREFGYLAGCDRRGELLAATEWHFEQGIRALARALREKGLERGIVGLEMLDLPAVGLKMLEADLPAATFVDATEAIRQDMARKTDREIAFIAKAVASSEAGFARTVANMRQCVGRPMSEMIWRHYSPEVSSHHADFLGSNLSGEAWEWRQEPEPALQAGGIPVNFDILVAYQGMISDIAFRAVVGEPDRAFKDEFAKSVRVVETLCSTVRPGMTAREAEALCLENLGKAVGEWSNYWAVHSCGFWVHEFPQIGSASLGRYPGYVFEAGQVLSVEAIAEQAFVLTDSGMKRIGAMPMEIYVA